MQEKIILTERKSRRISVGKFLLNVNDLQVALAGGRADKSAIIYAVATEKLKVKGKQISPRRLRAKYTHRTNQRFVLRIFRPAGSCSADRRIVRKRMPMHPLTNDMAEFILPKTRRECLSEEIHLFK